MFFAAATTGTSELSKPKASRRALTIDYCREQSLGLSIETLAFLWNAEIFALRAA